MTRVFFSYSSKHRSLTERLRGQRRFPDAAEVAAAVVYLASPAAASITGHVLRVDGGLTAE